jgi:hypothetical protein
VDCVSGIIIFSSHSAAKPCSHIPVWDDVKRYSLPNTLLDHYPWAVLLHIVIILGGNGCLTGALPATNSKRNALASPMSCMASRRARDRCCAVVMLASHPPYLSAVDDVRFLDPLRLHWGSHGAEGACPTPACKW